MLKASWRLGCPPGRNDNGLPHLAGTLIAHSKCGRSPAMEAFIPCVTYAVDKRLDRAGESFSVRYRLLSPHRRYPRHCQTCCARQIGPRTDVGLCVIAPSCIVAARRLQTMSCRKSPCVRTNDGFSVPLAPRRRSAAIRRQYQVSGRPSRVAPRLRAQCQSRLWPRCFGRSSVGFQCGADRRATALANWWPADCGRVRTDMLRGQQDSGPTTASWSSELTHSIPSGCARLRRSRGR